MMFGVAGCIRESQFDSVVRCDFITARNFGLKGHFLTVWYLEVILAFSGVMI
jgi:hypothetical protein